jgi:membrane protein implicated in regulation of membrane protease activity
MTTDIYLLTMGIGFGLLVGINILRFFGLIDFDFDDVDLSDSDGAMNYLSIEALAWFTAVTGIAGYSLQSAPMLHIAPKLIALISIVLGLVAVIANLFITKHFPRLLTTHDGLIRSEDLLGLKAKTVTKVDSNGYGTILVSVKGKLAEYIAYSDELIPPSQEVIITDKLGTKLKVRKN